MTATKEEMIAFRDNYLEENKYLVEHFKNNSDYLRLLRERSHYPAELLYEEAKGIIEAIERGEIKESSVLVAKQYAIASLDAIKIDKVNKELLRRK